MVDKYDFLEGYATSSGTKKYRDDAVSNKKLSPDHFRLLDKQLYLSSIGMGTYLGKLTADDDIAIENAVYESIKSRIVNVIDTAINYRAMKSERSVGHALSRLVNERIISRDQVFISTKNGFIAYDGCDPADSRGFLKQFVARKIITEDYIDSPLRRDKCHIMHSEYIAGCIDRSLKNLRLETIDLVYLHNAFEESLIQGTTKAHFMQKLLQVFKVYEEYRSKNKIRYYGMATWSCFRVHPDSREYLSLEEMVRIAEKVGGKQHGFRFIQLPYNLDYPEAFLLKSQTADSEKVNILDAAKKLNIGIFTSAPFLHGHLLKAQIPDYAGLTDPVTKAVQIIRSSPSVIAPLIGQKDSKHIEQNLAIANIPPMNQAVFTQEVQKLLKVEPLFKYMRTTLTKEEKFKLEEWKAKDFSDNEALVAIKILNQPNVCILCGNSFPLEIKDHVNSPEIIREHLNQSHPGINV